MESSAPLSFIVNIVPALSIPSAFFGDGAKRAKFALFRWLVTRPSAKRKVQVVSLTATTLPTKAWYCDGDSSALSVTRTTAPTAKPALTEPLCLPLSLLPLPLLFSLLLSLPWLPRLLLLGTTTAGGVGGQGDSGTGFSSA